MADDDIGDLLKRWAHEPGHLNARTIEGTDGRTKLQIRLDLGVLQLELEGRPDGLRPEGHESILDLQRDRLERYERESESVTGFVLSAEECRALREEAVQYYHRYVACFTLGDYERVVRDVDRNLEAFDLCRLYGATEIDRGILEQFRPHLLMMRARSRAEIALGKKQPKDALTAIDDGLDAIRSFVAEAGFEGSIDDLNEMQILRGMRDALVPKLPASQRVEIEERLRAALDAENYELAAILRDELRMMQD